jgi:hypothetical protein
MAIILNDNKSERAHAQVCVNVAHDVKCRYHLPSSLLSCFHLSDQDLAADLAEGDAEEADVGGDEELSTAACMFPPSLANFTAFERICAKRLCLPQACKMHT